MDVKDWGELRDHVDDRENVLTCKMRDLRELQGAETLGTRVVEKISDQLNRAGLGHVPLNLPTHGGEKVRLYTLGSEVGDLIVKALHPGESQDEGLRERVESGPADKLEQIREIVCQSDSEEDG